MSDANLAEACVCIEDSPDRSLDTSDLVTSQMERVVEEEDKLNKGEEDIRDELDFEEDKESGEEDEEEEEGEAVEEVSPDEDETSRKVTYKEEGELSDEDEDESLLRQEPKTVCRFFNKGQCTWGTNCRFLHPGVSDKGNYNMFAPSKPSSQGENAADASQEKEKEVRRPTYEPPGFESAWERGLRYAKEMKKKASKRKETDADFEEKRFNLSLGQAELDRENDYYTRPASPVYKPSDEVIEYLDPYERQAIRHFRGGHFENLEVRYNVDPAHVNRGSGNVRSRRDKFEREVTERIPRKMRVAPPSPMKEDKIKEKRYPKEHNYKGDRYPEVGRGEAEVWADPWARRKTPVTQIRKKKISRTRSYSSGSSSKSSRSSRSSSFSKSSYSRSSSRSSKSNHSRAQTHSRSITPPIHPRQHGGMRGGARGHWGFPGRGGRGGNFANNYLNPPYSQFPNQQINSYHQYPSQFGQPPNFSPNVPLGVVTQTTRRANPNPNESRAPHPNMKQEPTVKYPQEEPPNIERKPETKRQPTVPLERVDMFGRTIRKDVPKSPSPRSASPSPVRMRRKKKFSVSQSRSGSSSHSYSKSRSRSLSTGSKSSSSSIESIPKSPISRKRERDRKVQPQGVVSYGESVRGKAIDLVKVAGQKQQIKLTLKKQGPVRPDKTVIGEEDDSGESDVDARILKKRKLDSAAVQVTKPPTVTAPTAPPVIVAPAAAPQPKKPSAARREELLKQLRAVEDAIARKRSKPLG